MTAYEFTTSAAVRCAAARPAGTRLLPAFLAIVCALGACFLVPSAHSADLVSPWVRSEGQRFVDASGATVRLRGVDVPGFPGTSFYAKAVGLGVNFVRVPVYWSDVEQQAPVDGVHTWNATVLSKVDTAVDYYRQNGVNVLLDFHQFNWSPYWTGGKGIPAWFYADGRFSSRNAAEAAWWTDPAGQDAFEAFASMMIERYRGYANVVGYEIFNEPQPGNLGQNHAATQAILTWEAAVVDDLKGSDPERTFFLTPRQGGCLGLVNGDFSVFSSLAGIALDCHLYFPGENGTGFSSDQETWSPTYDATHNQSSTSYTGTEANQEAVLLVLLNRARSLGIPLIVGEWGARRDDSGLLTYQDQVLRVYDKYGVSWARWALSTTDSQGILTSSGGYTNAARQLSEHLLSIAPTNSTGPSISGFPQEGTMLTADPGEWTGTGPKTYEYEWQRCNDGCTGIPGGTGSTYLVASDDVGFSLRVQVTATDSGGSSAATSAPTATVVAGGPPVNTAAPTVSGTAEEGKTLAGTPGTWTSAETPSYRYQWERCDAGGQGCANIANATASSYKLAGADVDHTVVLAVYAKTSGGEAVARGGPTAVVAPLPPAMTEPTAAFQTAVSFTAAWASTSASSVATFDVSLQTAGLNGAFGTASLWQSATGATSATFNGAPGATYCFSALARTAAGAVTRSSVARCTAVPVDDAALVATGRWKRATTAGYFRGTYSRSSTAGDRLTLTGIQAKRLAVVATKCPGCGTIKLVWNGVVLQQVSLASTKTQRKQVVAQVALAGLQSGDVSVVVATGGSPVEIDGLGIGEA
jgi:aryl-phospho-beta-D-glucosidase BglC (GH1 family)